METTRRKQVEEYLSRATYLDRRIDNKLSELAQWRSLSTSISTKIGGNEGSYTPGANKDKMASIVAKIVDLENEIDEMIDDLVLQKKQIISTIEKVENARLYDILFKVFVESKQFGEVSADMDLSYSHVRRLYDKALEQIEPYISID